MTDVVGNPEEERRAAFYHEPWSQEAVSRYFYCKVRGAHQAIFNRASASSCSDSLFSSQIQQRRQELEQALAVRNT